MAWCRSISGRIIAPAALEIIYSGVLLVTRQLKMTKNGANCAIRGAMTAVISLNLSESTNAFIRGMTLTNVRYVPQK